MSFSSNFTDNISFNLSSVVTTITTATTVSNVVIATEVLSVIDRYIEISLYILGVCGTFLNIFTFLQKQLRSNPCSMYFLGASFCDLCTCNILILVKIVSFFDYQRYVELSNTSFWCKFGNYCMFLFPCLSSLYITLASIDRFCTSSRRAGLRKLSTIKVSRVVTPCIFLIWSIFSLQVIIGYDWRKLTPTATTLTCTPQRNGYTFFVIVDGFFFVLFNGAIVPFFLAFFGIFIIRHIQQTQHRTAAVIPIVPILPSEHGSAPTTAAINRNSITIISRTNRHLIIMLLVQVLLTLFLNLSFVIVYLNNIYNRVTLTPFYLTVIYVTTWLWYLNYCKTFYINTLSSRLFRSILKQQVLYLLHRLRTLVLATWSTTEDHQT